MARRSDHSREQIREMALDAAENILKQKGYSALSARRVAAEIGYTVGTLYLVFQNLDDLILQVNGRTLDALYARLLQVKQTCQGNCALALGQGYLDFAMQETERWTMIFAQLHAPDAERPDWYQAKVNRIFALIEDALHQIAPEQDTDAIAIAARALWSGVHGVCVLGLAGRLGQEEGTHLDMLVTSLIENYLLGFQQRC